MKIAWFTPFAADSRVARFSGIVTRELSRHADVDIWHPPAPSLLSTALRTIAMPRRVRVSPAMIEAYDLAVYNLGEEDDGRIAEAACAAPGIAVVHGPGGAAVRRAYAAVVHSEFAREFAAPTEIGLSPRKYASAVLAIAEAVLPGVPVLRCVDMMAGRLAEIDVQPSTATLDRVAREAYDLFGRNLA